MVNSDKQIYMDYAATHPLSLNTKNYITSLLDVYGNPSSQYELSDKSRKIISNSRQAVSQFINAKVDDIYFTSSGSASNTLGIRGYLGTYPDTNVYYSPIAHKSILKCLPNKSYPLIVSKTGMIFESDLDYVLRNDKSEHKLVVIDYANSEIGTIQNVKDLIEISHRNNAVIMIDATGSIPMIPLDINELGADIVTFSGHKLGSLKGIGVLYKRPEIELQPLVYGSQEQGLFGGTENIIGIASLYSAITEYDYLKETSLYPAVRQMWDYLSQNVTDCYLVGEPLESKNRLCNNLYVCFRNVDAEILVTLLSNEGIYVSTGSACNSGSKEPSPTLTSIKLEETDLHSCIRITVNQSISIDDMLYACEFISGFVEILRG